MLVPIHKSNRRFLDGAVSGQQPTRTAGFRVIHETDTYTCHSEPPCPPQTIGGPAGRGGTQGVRQKLFTVYRTLTPTVRSVKSKKTVAGIQNAEYGNPLLRVFFLNSHFWLLNSTLFDIRHMGGKIQAFRQNAYLRNRLSLI